MDEITFKNRVEAGERLAGILEKYRGSDAVVLALPRGGVVLARVVAKALDLPLGIVVVRKIGHPYNPEFAIAAISESGQIVKNEEQVKNIDQKWFQEEQIRQLNEAKRRREKYWGGQKPIDIKGKTVIIVDDGLATGLTMMAAIAEVKAQNPQKIVIAVPVSPVDTANKIESMVDEFVAIIIPELFIGAIGSYYEEFTQVSDEEVIELIHDPSPKAIFEMPYYQQMSEEIHKNLSDFDHRNYELSHFPNKELQIGLNSEVEGQYCFYIGSIEPGTERAMEYFLTCHTIKKERATRLIAILPYLAYMRQDKDESRKSLSADFVAKSLEAQGVDEIVTIDIHSSYAESYFDIPVISLSPALIFASRLKKDVHNFDEYSIVAPDEGAVDRAEDLKNELGIENDITYFLKERSGENVRSKMMGSEPKSKVIIVDDILDTGTTLIKCCELLVRSGVREIIVAVTHGLFTGALWKALLDLNVKQIITTDSSFRSKNQISEKVEVISVAPVLIDYLKNYE